MRLFALPFPVQDIFGTSSMRLHKDTNKPDRQLYHDDIEGSHPRNKFLFRTKRCVNPLEPEYTLPSFTVAPTVAPKFTRDSYDVSDIEGTKSRPLHPLKQRHNHLVDDIEVGRGAAMCRSRSPLETGDTSRSLLFVTSIPKWEIAEPCFMTFFRR